jgi:hypothetical protein
MKKQFTYLSIVILSAGLFFTSCKKESTSTPEPTETETELQVQSDDQARFSAETDAADDDANIALETYGGSYAGLRPLSPIMTLRCDASVTVDTVSNPRTITITYNGDTCIGGRRSRTGSIVLSFVPGFRWSAVGASYSINYQNLKITRLLDNKSITLSGTKRITNVSGGKLLELATRTTPIVHTIMSEGMSVTFDNGSQRSWKIAKRRTFTYNDGVVIRVAGIAPAAVGEGVVEWGFNRFNREYKNAILEPLTIRQSCNFRLVSGKIQHTGGLATTTTTFGLDAAGNPVTSCPNGPFYYKIVWEGINGQTRTHIGPY